MTNKLSRRDFVKMMGISAAGVALSGGKLDLVQSLKKKAAAAADPDPLRWATHRMRARCVRQELASHGFASHIEAQNIERLGVVEVLEDLSPEDLGAIYMAACTLATYPDTDGQDGELVKETLADFDYFLFGFGWPADSVGNEQSIKALAGRRRQDLAAKKEAETQEFAEITEQLGPEEHRVLFDEIKRRLLAEHRQQEFAST
ncbi:MAG: twin-arginine translocation signal domain-containing protein [Anaerolineae bacterium]|nr:twin-arginine translocation signal domain-containing protein [Anaerolineae bacterium]